MFPGDGSVKVEPMESVPVTARPMTGSVRDKLTFVDLQYAEVRVGATCPRGLLLRLPA